MLNISRLDVTLIWSSAHAFGRTRVTGRVAALDVNDQKKRRKKRNKLFQKKKIPRSKRHQWQKVLVSQGFVAMQKLMSSDKYRIDMARS